ncbi:Secreted beta-glucosidase sun1 [Gonapodya sp. JEL0774]|nr:Secreted beta-glucosidase sun1 [Gonapodya sp. JEL0774]
MSAPTPRKTRRSRPSTSEAVNLVAPTRAPRPRRNTSRASAASASDDDPRDGADKLSIGSSAPSHADLADESFPDAMGADVSAVDPPDGVDNLNQQQRQPRGDFFSSGVGALSYAVGPASSRTGHGVGGPAGGAGYKPVGRPANGSTNPLPPSSFSSSAAGPPLRGEHSAASNATTTTTTSASDKENDGLPGVGANRRPGKVPPSEAPPKRPKQVGTGPVRAGPSSPSTLLGDDLTHLTISTPIRTSGGGGVGLWGAIMSPLLYVKQEVLTAVKNAEDEARSHGYGSSEDFDNTETPGKKGRKGKGKGRTEGNFDDDNRIVVSVRAAKWGRGAALTRYCLFLAIPVVLILVLLVYPGAPADPAPTRTPRHAQESGEHVPIVTAISNPLAESSLNVTKIAVEPASEGAPPPGAVNSFVLGLAVGFARLRTLLLGDYATRADLAAALEKLETRVDETTTRVARDASEAKEAAQRAEKEAREAVEGSKAAAAAAEATAARVKQPASGLGIVWDGKLEDRLRKLVEEVAPVAAVARKGPDGHWVMDTTFYEYLRARLADGAPVGKDEGGFVTADAKGWRTLLDRVEADVAKFVDERARDLVDGRVVERDEVVEIVRRQMEKEVKDGAVQKALEKFAGEVGMGDTNVGQDRDNVLAAVLDRHLAKYGVRRADVPDYAAESTGGTVVRELTSSTYMMRPTGPISGLFGWVTGVGVQRFPPGEAIRGGSATPGECWAMRGTYGNLTIHLSIPIHVTSFTVEHLPPALAPNPTEGWKSAPRNISFHAIVDVREFKDTSGASGSVEIARTVYDPFADAGWKRVEVPEDGIERMAEAFTERAVARGGGKKSEVEGHERRLRKPFVDHVQVRIESNWGNKLYTCIYRVRVHGEVKKMAGALATAGIGNPI